MDLLEYSRTANDFKRHPWELSRLKILKFFLEHKIKSKDTILDLGSGDAFIAKSIAAAYPASQVYAVDINYNVGTINKLSEGQKNILFKTSIENDQSGQKIDVVLLMDVLEHIEMPANLLRELNKIIKKETVYFITVPAFQSLFTEHDVLLGHYRRYNFHQLEQLLLKDALQIIDGGYFFTSLLIFRVFQKIFKLKMTEDGLYNWKGGDLLT
ncbi:MAG TPA: methyltransferase domain-containing protein, partial [Flavisolibacter sp.]|nr:methyltransferase domain-containing protein [Flavisolibacter sp.]